jgi:hypothetical protein
MFRKMNLLLGAVLMTALVSACGSARVIQQTQYGGVIALEGDRGKAMEAANEEMAAHCGPGQYQVVQQGEEAIGTDTVASSDTQYDKNGENTQAGTSTRTAVEWRIHYQCANAPPPPAAEAPPAEAPPAPPY